MEIIKPIRWDSLEGHYPALADAFRKKTESKIILSTTVDISNIFDLILVEEDRNIMKCICCEQFFGKIGTSAYFDERGDLVSAFWDSSVAMNPEAATAIDAIAKHINGSLAKNTLHLSPYVPEEAQVGEITKGGYEHFYAIFDEAYPKLEPALFPGVVTLMRNLAKDCRGIANFCEAAKKVHDIVSECDDVTASFKERIANIYGISQTILHYKDAGPKVQAAAIIQEAYDTDMVNTVTNLVGVRGDVIWVLYSAVINGGNVNHALNALKSRTSTGVYKARDTSKVTADDLRRAHAALQGTGVLDNFPMVVMSSLDVMPEWAPSESPRDETDENLDAMAKLIAEKDIKTNADDLIVLKDIQHVSVSKFVRDILPRTQKLEVGFSHGLPIGFMVKGAKPQATPFLIWDRPEERRNFVTVMGQVHAPYGQPIWREVSAIIPKPWGSSLTEVIKGIGSLTPGFIAMCDVDKLPSGLGGVNDMSIAEALRPEWHQHRASIDYMFGATAPHVPESKVSVLTMVGPNNLHGVFRCTNNNIVKTYQLSTYE